MLPNQGQDKEIYLYIFLAFWNKVLIRGDYVFCSITIKLIEYNDIYLSSGKSNLSNTVFSGL